VRLTILSFGYRSDGEIAIIMPSTYLAHEWTVSPRLTAALASSSAWGE
jgi:hypothetical protein